MPKGVVGVETDQGDGHGQAGSALATARSREIVALDPVEVQSQALVFLGGIIMLFTWLKRYADFAGRSSRKEYWMGFLGYVLIAVVAALVDAIAGSSGIIYFISIAACIVPLIALGVRRLHDLDPTGWLTLLGLIPLIGLILLYWAVQPGQPRANRFGAPPPETPNLTPEAAEVFS